MPTDPITALITANSGQARDKAGRFAAGDAVTVDQPGTKMHGRKGKVVKQDHPDAVHVEVEGGEDSDNYGASPDKRVHAFHPTGLRKK